MFVGPGCSYPVFNCFWISYVLGDVLRPIIRLVSKGMKHSFDQRLNGIVVCVSRYSGS